MDFEAEQYQQLPEINNGKGISLLVTTNRISGAKTKKRWKKSTFWMLSVLPKAELKGELLQVYVLGLFVPDEAQALLGSVLHLCWLQRDINVLRPANQTSASSLSLHIQQMQEIDNHTKQKK